ncbi:hypothetical protein A4H97_20140 [Niastella yeongjuensis]|uniref:Phage tail collar domain-containing protein n=1 Tax=Niastella yeongjuensis TaxID=354355 RepID=A0A1V9FBY4_9BACT|nr:tail fiber protein [Niastella yeongjuensis]OQP55903.1 hypothetical protein A4H97_20140 [Niastella yeongjuensis]SEP27343.1 Microcystin-dependent protein [Niastella yeongjuensis]
MDNVIGEIKLFAGNFAPAGWVFCDGRSLNPGDYDNLFQLIGTTYGGDGINDFKVPDLQSRAPIGAGQGVGLPNYNLGETGGTETNTLTVNNLPTHTHTYNGTGLLVSSEDGHKTSIAGNYQAVNGDYIYSTVANTQMAAQPTALTIWGVGTAVPNAITNLKPYLVISYIICFDGIIPQP